MKKIFELVLALLCAGSVVLSCGACKDNNNLTNTISINSAYNTAKVMRDGDYEKLEKRIDVFMAKGEKEGAQLIVTPENDVDDIVVNVSDLKLISDTEKIFPKEKVTVYFQKYINVLNKTVNNNNQNYPAGYTPDLLLEQSIAIKNDENNIKAKKNQGITIEFETTQETAAGIYVGSFSVVADGVAQEIPVRLEVYDITLSALNGQSCFCDYTFKLNGMAGEYDTTDELYKKYYESAMRDYKIMLEDVPGKEDPIEMAENVDRYYDELNFTGYNIPNETYDILIEKDENGNEIYETKMRLGNLYSYYWELAVRSRPGRILLDKAYMYLVHFDEARSEKFATVRTAMTDILGLEKQIFADLEKTGYFDEYSSQYRDEFYKSITGIPLILTGGAIQVYTLGTDVNTYCVRIDGLASKAERELYEEIEKYNADIGGETWYYTCQEPPYPYPTHHIDDTLLSSRVMRWMQKDYDYEGYLYWAVFTYDLGKNGVFEGLDPYEAASHAYDSYNGDGFLVYPGKKYGVDVFLPSLRLLSIRDGQEDYDLLCLFEQLLKEKSEYYGISEINSHTYLQDFYDRLYTDVFCVDDNKNFYEVRKQLFDLILTHKSNTKFLAEKKIEGTSATVNVYLANGYQLSVNGQTVNGTVCGQGMKYVIRKELNARTELTLSVTKDGKEVENHNFFVSDKVGKVTLDENIRPLYCSEGSSITYKDGTASVTLHSFGETSGEMIKNKPSVGILSAAMENVKLGDLDFVEFSITNKNSKALKFTVRFKTQYSDYALRSYIVEAGETLRVKVDAIYTYLNYWSNLNNATVDICVENAYLNEEGNYEKYPDRTVELFDVYYGYKGE